MQTTRPARPGSLEERLAQARRQSWVTFGRRITFYLPGLFVYDGISGKYPALSITGDACTLQCDHCQGRILSAMIPAVTPERLVRTCLDLQQKGHVGVLISGGCDASGQLPWERYIPAISRIKDRTDLYVSVHCGLVDGPTAGALKAAGVDQALIDVIGDDDTYQRIYHVDFGVSRIQTSLDHLHEAGIPTVPHVVCGLDYGRLRGESRAVDMISRFPVSHLVIVSLMRLPHTPVRRSEPVAAEAVADLIAYARLTVPGAKISLGCARERGNTRMEVLAVEAGVNRMALPSAEAISRAEQYGLETRFQRTCCSVAPELSSLSWQREP